MIQTWAILLDAYRELNARKMFWIALLIAGLVVLTFAGLGINERGVVILWYTAEIPWMNTNILSRELFYKLLFVNVGIGVWLGWASTILALVSTASVIPDFVSGGAIESMLARPISRTRLFLTKYAASLLFVILQSLVFTLASILAMGLRGGIWLWPLLWAVPIVTLFYSYLYCVSALVGVMTRSTLAALIAALALWGVVLVIGVSENILLLIKLQREAPIALLEKDIEARTIQIQQAKTQEPPDPANYAALEQRLAEKKDALAQQKQSAGSLDGWYRIAFTAKSILPKTGETKDLLERMIVTDKEMESLIKMGNMQDNNENRARGIDGRTARRADAISKSRPLWWVIGTSLAFEAVMVAWACRVFARRDF